MNSFMRIGDRKVGKGQAVYIIAEMSANHNQSFSKAVEIIKAAKKAGADAIKLQTYTADTITVDAKNKYLNIEGTIWDGQNLYDLYQKAHTPWEWQPELKKIATDEGLDFFSTPFDPSAVDFLESMDVLVYKIASFEVVDIPLIEKIAKTNKPIIMSTGMASLGEIEEAVSIIKQNGGNELALLKCVSAYPAPPEESNLRTIPHLSQTFGVPAGLSDHSMGTAIAVSAVSLGACILEKHFTLSRSDKGADSCFSMEPDEFSRMVKDIRKVEKALGHICYDLTDKQKESVKYRRSLFAVLDIEKGELLTEKNIRSIRPGCGLHTRYYKHLLGKEASVDIPKGTPLAWDMIC